MFGNHTLPETNMAPKNVWLKMKFLFKMVSFHGTFVNFRWSHISNIGGKRHIDYGDAPGLPPPKWLCSYFRNPAVLHGSVDILYIDFPIFLDLVLFGD